MSYIYTPRTIQHSRWGVFGAAIFRLKTYAYIFSAIIIISLCPIAKAASSTEKSAWQMQDLWEHGFAEIAHYEGRVKIGGRDLDVTYKVATRIVHLWPDTLTEAQSPPASARTIEALKTTYHLTFPGYAPRTEQVVSYSHREDLTPLRFVISTHDLGGTNYLTWSTRLGRLRSFTESLDAGEAQHILVAGERMAFVDNLPNRLRGLSMVNKGEWEIELVETLTGFSASTPIVAPARVVVGDSLIAETPAGKIPARRVQIIRPAHGDNQQVDTLYFQRNAPYRMIRWEQAQGNSFGLVTIETVPIRSIDGSFADRLINIENNDSNSGAGGETETETETD